MAYKRPLLNTLEVKMKVFFHAVLSAAYLLLLSFSSALSADPGKVTGAKPKAPHEVSAKLCGECHQEIYQEWSSSMHGQSTALSDPIHGAFYRSEVGDPTAEGQTMKNGKFPICLNCHAPNAALQKTTKLDAKPAYSEGVNCIFCHTITAFNGTKKAEGGLQLGVAAYDVSTSALQAPSGVTYTTSPTEGNETNTLNQPFHPFPMEGRNASLHKTSEVCMGCHDRRNNPNGVPLCATGTEISDSKQFVSCQSCHMPTVNGHASHSMLGGHDGDMVRRAVNMVLNVKPAGETLAASIQLINKLPHKFPTGAPFRTAIVKVTAYNEKGEVVWKNTESHPSKDDPQAAFMYILGDDNDKPAMPPVATKVLKDSRLDGNAERTLEYKIPATGVKTVRAELLYNLLSPPLQEKLNPVLTDDLKQMRRAAFSEVSL
jgi:hypothetical protein